jgi:hypothetical protein
MPNTIKYSVSAETLALKTGDFWIGTGDVGKGPTDTTGFYNGITPPSGGYTIYLNKASQGPSIYVPTNDSQLITLTNHIGGTNFTGATQCLNWFNTQSDKTVFNIDYPSIITSGLTLNLDTSFIPSYSTSGVTWYDLSPNGNNATLENGPTFNSTSGTYISFDGTDDYATCASTSTVNFTNKFTISLWIYINALPTNGNFANLITKYNVGTGGNGGYDFRFRNASGTQQIGLITLSSGAAEGGSDFNYTLSLNTWHYLSGVYNGSTSQVYLNTSLIGSVSNTTNPASNNKLLNIARFGQFGDTTLTRYYNGRIGQVKMYNRDLSATEIQQNYNATKSRFGL